MTVNDDILPDAANISPRGKARFVLNHANDASTAAHISGAALVGYATTRDYAVPDGVTLDEFAAIGDDVVGDSGGEHE